VTEATAAAATVDTEAAAAMDENNEREVGEARRTRL
jgi:hypothetical protein